LTDRVIEQKATSYILFYISILSERPLKKNDRYVTLRATTD